MDALPYIDTLFKEYLLFRGFTQTLRTFETELSGDKAVGFQVEKILDLLFHVHTPSYDAEKLLHLLDFLSQRFFSRLDSTFHDSTKKLETSVLRYYVVHAIQQGRNDKVKEFFEVAGDRLLQQSGEWQEWFAIPYLRNPSTDQRFIVYFQQAWVDNLLVSLRNCL
eukprot:gene26219-32131_t